MNRLKHWSFILKNKIFRKYAWQEYRGALANEYIGVKELNRINSIKRYKLVQFAKNHIPFYQEHYKGIKLDNKYLVNDSWWSELPVVEKSHIREFYKKLFNAELNEKQIRVVTTGGSTGEPLKLARDKRFPEEILQWRMLKRWNLSPAVDKLMFWRMPEGETKFHKREINKLLWWPTKRIRVDVSVLNDEKFEKITDSINKVKPKLFWGYVGALEQYALYLNENNIELTEYPECVWTTAAPISNVQRDLFKNVFKANILDQYACSEVHWVASSVPGSDNLILDYDYRHVDIVDEDNCPLGVNETGNILLTDLHNYAFPLIKYKVGDRASFVDEKNSFAPAFPMISPVKGRTSDYIKTKGGITIPGEYLTTIFDEYTEGILQFQINQLDYDNVEIQIVRSEQSDISPIINSVRSILKSKTNNELNIDFNIVDSIGHKSGKIRFVNNYLNN